MYVSCFNSRTREGCDQTVAVVVAHGFGFQFTHPGGVRLIEAGAHVELHYVSIHAPGRGATPSNRYSIPFLPWFQFTHPGGVRLAYNATPDNEGQVSIHAPGRGATFPEFASAINGYMFQFTHPGGVRL